MKFFLDMDFVFSVIGSVTCVVVPLALLVYASFRYKIVKRKEEKDGS